MNTSTSSFHHILVLIGRIGFAALFLPSGIGKLVATGSAAGFIASKGLPLPQVLAIVSGVVEVVGALMLLAGWRTRWAALGLAAFTLFAAVLFHDYWAAPTAQVMFQRISFFKNLGIAGGLFVLAAFGPGRLSFEGRERG